MIQRFAKVIFHANIWTLFKSFVNYFYFRTSKSNLSRSSSVHIRNLFMFLIPNLSIRVYLNW